MDIIIRNNSDKPIYEQITTQIKSLIINGVLQTDDALPSMRHLAKELRISVITTKRAYEELERDGFIYSIAGKGSYVAGKNTEFIREEHFRQAEAHLAEAVTAARTAGIGKQELAAILAMLWEEE